MAFNLDKNDGPVKSKFDFNFGYKWQFRWFIFRYYSTKTQVR